MPSDPALSPDTIVPMAPLADPSPPPPEAIPAETKIPEALKPVQLFDRRKPSLLTSGELRRLRMKHEEFARSLATRLSIHLRLEIGVRLAEIDTGYYHRFIDSLSNPTHVTLFGIETLDGTGLLEIPPNLGIAIIERLLGGPGKPTPLNRDLTEIETALLDQAVDLLLKEWCHVVASLPSAKAAILNH